jgi:beta-lactamase superfamily II metal-dependent hydrolase
MEALSYLELRRTVQEDGCRVVLARPGMILQIGGLEVRLFAPEKTVGLVDGDNPWSLRSAPPSGDELNSGSVVALVSYGESDFLIPGDAEAAVLEKYKLPPVEMVLVSHHGSRGALTEGLLGTLNPQAAAISVGEGNTYGHPDPNTLSLLRGSRATLLRTDQAGWVSFMAEEGSISVTTERRDGS